MIFAFGCNKNLYNYMAVNIYNLLKTNPKTKKIYLLLETEDINEIPYLKEVMDRHKDVELVLINFNNYKEKYIAKENPNVDTPYTDFAFCKLVLADFVKEDKVIYLDTDTIVVKDIYRLWLWDLGDHYVAGCKDFGVMNSVYFRNLEVTGKYINTGMMLLNLDKIRKDNIIPKIFEILNTRELKFPDQDAFNIICQNNIVYVPSIYNQAYYITNQVGMFELVKVWHLAGAKDKDDWLANNAFSEVWYTAEEEFFWDIVNPNEKNNQ